MKRGIVTDDVIQLGELEMEELGAHTYFTRTRLNELAIVVAEKGEEVTRKDHDDEWMTKDKIAVPDRFVRGFHSTLTHTDVRNILS